MDEFRELLLEGDVAAVGAFLDRNPQTDLNRPLRINDDTHFLPLEYACQADKSDLAQLLLVRKADPNVKLSSTSVMGQAVWSGGASLCNVLITHRADLNEKVGDQSLLHVAMVRGKMDVLELLLKNGADPDHPDCKMPPLWSAVVENDPHACRLLLKYGAHQKHQKHERLTRTLTNLARKQGYTAVASLLSLVCMCVCLCVLVCVFYVWICMSRARIIE